ncbi:4'-phosphopantetheinyl transferase family protein [Adhaeribacter rhizoryzae]|uniref:4'-phosphopantetheinyl transferase superfamily protein n=1 Tax=Adhaeribacter rhizoryzae TaxID=2607907 RepID=A0A5M6DQT0_9BACT|nr:4'-phosphopantetheinyl transferase family protein [Adhaeribacter rhizoryzae]KAA5548706.1 4'-phosphopantetheinyl transferase superfamily protein [Adhaeribacter rhizoryzae]
MALLNIREINPTTCIGFWEISETPECLRENLLNLTSNNLFIPEFASVTRQTQWLSSRILAYTLLRKFTNNFISLENNDYGKPGFEDEAYQISITHSHRHVAVILSVEYKVGIDIEIISPKVLRVADKFMNSTESNDAAGDLHKTLVYWSAKETLYKLYSKKQLIFKDNILIAPFALQPAGTLNTRIKTSDAEKAYTVHYEKPEEYILTYCVGEQNHII